MFFSFLISVVAVIMGCRILTDVGGGGGGGGVISTLRDTFLFFNTFAQHCDISSNSKCA